MVFQTARTWKAETHATRSRAQEAPPRVGRCEPHHSELSLAGWNGIWLSGKQLAADEVRKETEFGWQMQLRYYWDDETDTLVVRQTNASFLYAYEYLGAQSRLVVTPMTDRCYMTLTGALHLKLGGPPACQV